MKMKLILFKENFHIWWCHLPWWLTQPSMCLNTWGWNQMITILQTKLSYMCIHFLERFQLTIKSHYLKQWWLSSLRHISTTSPQFIKYILFFKLLHHTCYSQGVTNVQKLRGSILKTLKVYIYHNHGLFVPSCCVKSVNSMLQDGNAFCRYCRQPFMSWTFGRFVNFNICRLLQGKKNTDANFKELLNCRYTYIL